MKINQLSLNTNQEFMQKRLKLKKMVKEKLIIKYTKNKWFIILKNTLTSKNMKEI